MKNTEPSSATHRILCDAYQQRELDSRRLNEASEGAREWCTGVDRKTVKSIELSKVSPMPPMLLMMLKKEEILGLLAYVMSGWDKGNAAFGK